VTDISYFLSPALVLSYLATGFFLLSRGFGPDLDAAKAVLDTRSSRVKTTGGVGERVKK
jgi:hypothetical protein